MKPSDCKNYDSAKDEVDDGGGGGGQGSTKWGSKVAALVGTNPIV